MLNNILCYAMFCEAERSDNKILRHTGRLGNGAKTLGVWFGERGGGE